MNACFTERDTMRDVIEARGSRRAIVQAYNLFSVFYGHTLGRLERKALLRALARARVEPGERVLEVGVGTAAALSLLREALGQTGQLIGVDLASRMLAAARRKVPSTDLVQADALALPFPEGFFDLVWSSYLLDLIPTGDLVRLLEGLHRVLRPGGRLLLVNLSKDQSGLTLWERLYQRAPAWLVPFLFGGCRPVHALPIVQQAGFSAVEREFVSGFLDAEVVVARK